MSSIRELMTVTKKQSGFQFEISGELYTNKKGKICSKGDMTTLITEFKEGVVYKQSYDYLEGDLIVDGKIIPLEKSSTNGCVVELEIKKGELYINNET